MTTSAESLRDTIEAAILKVVSEVKIEVSSAFEDYSVFYISEKLALCSSNLVKLGDFSSEVSLWSLAITRKIGELKMLMELKAREVKSTEEWKCSRGDERNVARWPSVSKYLDELSDWEMTKLFLGELRTLILEKTQLMKRLDSDLRLQQKLLESSTGVSGVAARRALAVSQNSVGGVEEEIEI